MNRHSPSHAKRKLMLVIFCFIIGVSALAPTRAQAEACTSQTCGGVGCPLPSGIINTVMQGVEMVRSSLEKFQTLFGDEREEFGRSLAASLSNAAGANQGTTSTVVRMEDSVAQAAATQEQAEAVEAAAIDASLASTPSEATMLDAEATTAADTTLADVATTQQQIADNARGSVSGQAGLTASANNSQRFNVFLERYCHPQSSDGALNSQRLGCAGAAARYNRDIRYDLAVDAPLTLARDGTDKEDVDFLQSYLYGNQIPNPVTEECLTRIEGAAACHATIMRWRRFMALLGLANDTYTSIVSAKTAPEAAVDPQAIRVFSGYMEEAFEGDLTPARALTLGESPSYYAQSEAITRFRQYSPKHLPRTFAPTGEGLHELERQRISQDVIGLYQAFEHLETLHGWEAKLSALLDMRIERRFPVILESAGGVNATQ